MRLKGWPAMCTSVRFTSTNGSLYFGRNLDWESGYGEQPVFTPRNWNGAWAFEDAQSRQGKASSGDGICRNAQECDGAHSARAVLGMAVIAQNIPLYFDCMNEDGLAIAGLLFAGFANYEACAIEGKTNIASYEFPLWVARNFSTVDQVKEELGRVAIIGKSIAGMEPSQLHWMIVDASQSIVVEYTEDGMHVYDDPVDVLANQPAFDWHVENLRSYYMVRPDVPDTTCWGKARLEAYGSGAGMRALPGDYYSPSRFIRAAYLNAHYPAVESETDNVARLFHTLQSVSMIEGASRMKSGNFEKTIYTSGYSQETGSCYYNTYDDFTLKRCRISDFDRNGDELLTVRRSDEQIR